MRIEREITSVFGTTSYDYDQTSSENLDADRRNCDDTIVHKSVCR